LKQPEDGTAISEVWRKAGISDATFYNWQKKYAELLPSEMRRLRQLEEDNGKPKRIVADLSFLTRPCSSICYQKNSKACRKCELVDKVRFD
jgi:Transposase